MNIFIHILVRFDILSDFAALSEAVHCFTLVCFARIRNAQYLISRLHSELSILVREFPVVQKGSLILPVCSEAPQIEITTTNFHDMKVAL